MRIKLRIDFYVSGSCEQELLFIHVQVCPVLHCSLSGVSLWLRATPIGYVLPCTICLLQGVVLDVSDCRSWRGMPKGRNTNELRGRVAWHHANSLLLLLHFLSFNNNKTTSYLFVYTKFLKCVLVKQKFVCPRAVLAYAAWILGLNARDFMAGCHMSGILQWFGYQILNDLTGIWFQPYLCCVYFQVRLSTVVSVQAVVFWVVTCE
jgi:hypothetical protein